MVKESKPDRRIGILPARLVFRGGLSVRRSPAELERQRSAFFEKSPAFKAFLLATLAATYGLAIAFYPISIKGASTSPWFMWTYVGCVAVSACLSALALFARQGPGVFFIAAFRLYALLVLGYGLGAYLSTKLILGIGLMVELCVIGAFPANLAVSVLFIAILALAQAFPVFFGNNGLFTETTLPRPDELATLCLAMAATAGLTAWTGRLLERHREVVEALRIHERNLDTLAELNQNLQVYARTVDEDAAERERNRISREIHDISGYIFTNLIALMDAAGSMPREDHKARTELLVTARRQAQEGLQETRSALRRLRGESTRLADNAHALHRIVSIFRSVAGIEVDLNLGNLPRLLPADLNLAIYRTVQEGLTNAVRHGHATLVRIAFWVEDGTLSLSIGDNGKGAFEVVKGIGLSGMEERVGALGGSVRVGRSIDGGFALDIRVPLPGRQPAARKEQL